MKKFSSVILVSSILLLIGCEANNQPPTATVNLDALPDQPPVDSIEMLDVQFEPAVRLKTTSGDFVSVESPGYACPTLVDLNKDGQLDLVVGQFTDGKMKVFYGRNQSQASLEFGDGDWIRSSGTPAQVPGIS
jgi:hypothetical protein